MGRRGRGRRGRWLLIRRREEGKVGGFSTLQIFIDVWCNTSMCIELRGRNLKLSGFSYLFLGVLDAAMCGP